MRIPRYWWLLLLAPVSWISKLAIHNDLLTFFTAAGAVIPLAGLIGRSTDQLAMHAGPRLGGLLNASFGNVTELIVAIFLLLDDQIEVVKASLIGSIIGNLLLVLGLSMFLGGLRHEEQRFSARAASVHATSLALAVVGLLMPALFVLLAQGQHGLVQREVVSVTIALVLIALYGSALVFTLVTHQHLFRTPTAEERPTWSVRMAVAVLTGATVLVAVQSELLVGALDSIDATVADLGLSKFFVGLILIPIIGNAAEHGSAVFFALRDKLDVSLEIAIGSSTQIALFVAPVLVLISLIVGHPMDFVFSPFEIAAVALSTFIMALISLDGRSNWLEGAQLIGAYAIMGVSFFFVEKL
jgi:Ca2+:H+ antiporter